MADKTHDVHQTPDGKYRWVEGAGGVYRHDQMFKGVARSAHPSAEPEAQFVPLGIVVLRCKCSDPDSHPNQHCPEAEIDIAESYDKSATFNMGPANTP